MALSLAFLWQLKIYPLKKRHRICFNRSSLVLSVVGVQVGRRFVPPITTLALTLLTPQFRELVGQRVESGANPLVYDSEDPVRSSNWRTHGLQLKH